MHDPQQGRDVHGECCPTSIAHSRCIFILCSWQIFYDPSPIGVTYDEIGDGGSALPEPLFLAGSRLVVHFQTSESAVDDFLGVVRTLAEEKRAAGFVRPEGQTNVVFKDVYVRRIPKANK